LVSQQDGIKAAFFGFQDRYRALPGDYAAADTNINCGANPCAKGNGNARIESASTPINASVTHEETLVWSHLTSAGFLNGSYTFADTAATDANTPKNPYGSLLDLVSPIGVMEPGMIGIKEPVRGGIRASRRG